jgi:MFS family permease
MIDKLSNTTKAFVVCLFAAIFYCYEYYLRVAPSVISVELMQSFDISNAGLGVLSACFYYAYMPVQIPVGLLLDRFGPRIVLTFACAICVTGTYIFTATNLIWMAQLGRLIVGFGSAFAFVGFLKISTNWLPHKLYALMVGMCMLLGMFGAMSGEVLLAWMVERMTWQYALELSALCGVILTILMWLIIRDEPTNLNHRHPKQKHREAPLLVALVKSLKNPQIWLVGMIGCLSFLTLSSFAEMWAVPYLMEIGYSKTSAAFASSMVFLGFGLGGPFWGMLSNWLRSRRIPLMLGCITSCISAALIIYKPEMLKINMFICSFILGFCSSAEILVFAVGNDLTSKNSSATTTSIINMLVMLGGIIMQPLIGIILDVISLSSVSQYQTALLVLPISLLLAAILSYILAESYTE